MTDNEIIKALEICSSGDITKCKYCPSYRGLNEDCCDIPYKDVLNLINRQKAEIESMRNETEKLGNAIGRACELNCFLEASRKIVGNEAIKEFVERFNALLEQYADYDTLHIYEIKDRVDIVEEEMTEVSENE